MIFSKPHILLVDDKASALSDIEDALKENAMCPTFDFITPKDRKKPIEDELPRNSQLNGYDIALIDLQFYDPIHGLYDLHNLSGGHNVLPYLRKNAPWLPVIAFSKLFSDDQGALQALAGSFGFDGHIPRILFPTNKINRDLWRIIVNQAVLLRKRAVMGAEYDREKAQSIGDDMIVSDPAELSNILDNNFPLWRKVIRDSFYYSDQIILSSIPGGFSGAVTLRAEVIEKKVGRVTAGNWLVKISKSPWQLNMEVNAHLEAIRSGQEYARTVPLLWNGVVVENKIGLIAYQFAKNTKVALECLCNTNDALILCGNLKSMFTGMYPPEKVDDKQVIALDKFIATWFSSEQLRKAAGHLSDSKFQKTLLAIADDKAVNNIPNALKPNLCWLHGDLHLRNILMGERNLLIDFARSKMGPLVLDLAKFASDLLLRVDELRTDKFPVFMENKNQRLLEVLNPINSIFKFNDYDIILYNLLLKIYLAIALDYPDVDDNAKHWIKAQLKGTE
jgi:CheY-like chemotaxis protein